MHARTQADGNLPMRLKIAYILPQFPVATQTFAVSDIAAVLALGNDVTVHVIKPLDDETNAALTGIDLPDGLGVDRPQDLRITALISLRRLLLSAKLAGRCISMGFRSPKELAIALACVPRAIEISESVRFADVVHAFWGRHPSLVLEALRLRGAPPIRSMFVGAYDLVKADFLVDIGLGGAHLVFTHAEANRPFFAERGIAHLKVIHRGIPLDRMPRSNAPRDPDLLITASALNSEKNVEGVIRAFAAATRSHANLKLWVCGSGPEENRLRKVADTLGVANAVTFHGYVRRERLFEMMQQSAIYLNLSTKASERLPNVLKEAMFAGCYIISSPSDGIEELIFSPAVGDIVPADDEAQILASIDRAIAEDNQAADRRRRTAMTFVTEQMSSARSMRRYVEEWRSVISGAGH
jgi:glycosyltransferase involved in cell wall biosynthesis